MAAGDPAGLSRLYDSYAPRLLALGVHVLRDQGEAEDVLHDVFMEAWKRAGSFDAERAAVRTWLVVRMRSRCLDRLRARNVRADAPEARLPAPVSVAPPERMEAAADVGRIRDAVATLPDAQRRVMELLYFEGLSSREAAERIGCPVGSVKSRVRLAMTSLRRDLLTEEAR